MKMIKSLFFILSLVTSSTNHNVDGVYITLNEDLELERQLKLINKSPIKSFQTKFREIVDCIDIHKQSAFDHPLLKNHKLQMKPSFGTIIENTSVKNSSNKLLSGSEKIMCPIGTVPIRRITKDDLINDRYLLYNQSLYEDNSISHVAQVSLKNIPGSPYYGVSGATSIWNPKVSDSQTSSSNIWVQNGDADIVNKIVVGWHVSPHLYNDSETHIFSLWTSDNFKKTGCYNTICPGFVQVDSEYAIGNIVTPTSVYDGPIYDMSISIFQDEVSKNWWVNIQGISIGYFPAALFFNLNTADQVGWGGKITTAVDTPSPSMGSGYFPDSNFIHACYFRQIKYRNELRQDTIPESDLEEKFNDVPKCYVVDTFNSDSNPDIGCCLHFGGPGGSC